MSNSRYGYTGLIDHAICSLFENDKVKECTLEDFL